MIKNGVLKYQLRRATPIFPDERASRPAMYIQNPAQLKIGIAHANQLYAQ
jgi:hypothetical protein